METGDDILILFFWKFGEAACLLLCPILLPPYWWYVEEFAVKVVQFGICFLRWWLGCGVVLAFLWLMCCVCCQCAMVLGSILALLCAASLAFGSGSSRATLVLLWVVIVLDEGEGGVLDLFYPLLCESPIGDMVQFDGPLLLVSCGWGRVFMFVCSARCLGALGFPSLTSSFGPFVGTSEL